MRKIDCATCTKPPLVVLTSGGSRTKKFNIGAYFHVVSDKNLSKDMLVGFMDRIKWSDDAPPLGFVDYQFSPLDDNNKDEVSTHDQMKDPGLTDQDGDDLTSHLKQPPRLIVRNKIAPDAAVDTARASSTVFEYCRLEFVSRQLPKTDDPVIVLLPENRVACYSYAWLHKNHADLMQRIKTPSKQLPAR
jgi:hypothetical protein